MVKHNSDQLMLFDCISDTIQEDDLFIKEVNQDPIVLKDDVIRRLFCYELNDYISDVEHNGLKRTWDYICQFVIENIDSVPSFLDIKNFGELYEIGLAVRDKVTKKKSGQYYTPDDVATVMAEWLCECQGNAVCDVACGTGKLILTYLDMIGYSKARELISEGRLYLYDLDEIALKICKTTISIKYGLDIAGLINDIHCDFLDKSIMLPSDSIVISNPPYAKIDTIQKNWKKTDVLCNTKEYYSAFMDKIIGQAKSTVIITPFSFISGAKFYSLRKRMSQTGHGFVVAFDNVPGNVFCGRKHGIFNTNTTNSVRAAITVMHQSQKNKGFRISPLIRFKNEERERLFRCKTLERTLSLNHQIVDDKNEYFRKIDDDLFGVFNSWINKSEETLADFLSVGMTEYFIDMPNTCRYYTTASSRKLNRTGSISMYLRSSDEFNFIYCFINSSFAYWWWRIYDGAITYPLSLLYSLPVPYSLLNDDDKKSFASMAEKLIVAQDDFTITKINAGVPQENIKFPEKYRADINKKILSLLGFPEKDPHFRKVHSNRYFEETK